MKNAIRLVTMAGALFVGINVLAATTWTGVVDDNWSTAGNWTGGLGGSGDPDVIIDGSDSNGVINVDIDLSLNPLTTMVITNASTNIVISGNALYLAPTATGDIIQNLDNSFVHTFNNDVISPNNGVNTTLWINPGGSRFVFNGELYIDPASTDNWEFRNGGVTVNNKITCNALRIAWGGTKVISNGVDNAINSVVSVNDGAVMVVDTPAGTNFFNGFKFQHNSNADYTFNNANVIGDSTRIIAGGTRTLTYRFNADEDLGYISIGSGTMNLVLGESVNTLAFDGGNDNNWASLHITGFRENVIRFGTSSNDLTVLQLETITAEGVTGGALLDENGYLSFAGEPPLVTGEIVVDYDTSGGNTSARPADIESDTGYTWNFSETEPLFDNAGQNRTIYGGVITSWSVATNYMPEVALTNGQIWARVSTGTGGHFLKAMYVWPKEEFLLGSNGTVSFTNGNLMTVTEQFMTGGAGGQSFRLTVKQGGSYYVSDENISSGGNFQTLFFDPSDPTVNWAPISTNDYTIGTYGPVTFTDIEALGIFVDINHTSSGLFVTFNDFQTRAIVEIPPPTEISDVSSALVDGQFVVSWQGTNTANYILQMRENLLFGTWSNLVNMAGVNDIMSVTNTTDASPAFFRTILDN